ncbi:MAG: LapA family protein [Burkholderiales bacterium]|nr:LapA family protein [Burkholderiales bacterium]
MNPRLIFSLAIVILAIVFALQNATTVMVVFVVWRFESSLALLLGLTFVAGAILSALLSTSAAMRKSWKLSQQERLSGGLEKRVAELEQLVTAKESRIRELESRGGNLP